VTEKKVCAWLQDEVLQRILEPRRARGTRLSAAEARAKKGRQRGRSKPSEKKGKGKEPAALAESGNDGNDGDDMEMEMEMELERQLEGELEKGLDDDAGAGVVVQPGRTLGYTTVKLYVSAIAELYHHQVSAGLNAHPSFRRPGLKGLMVDLERTQATKALESFEDRGGGGAQGGYTEAEFLRMQEFMLSSVGSKA